MSRIAFVKKIFKRNLMLRIMSIYLYRCNFDEIEYDSIFYALILE